MQVTENFLRPIMPIDIKKIFGYCSPSQNLSNTGSRHKAPCISSGHPRDLFDVKHFFEKYIMSDELRQAFVVYLCSDRRPFHEILSPNIKRDQSRVFENEFIGIMHATIFPSAIQAVEKDIFAGTKHLLDVGGGSGCFASAFVKKYPHTNATIFELLTVCEATKPYLEEQEVQDLVDLISGNFLQDPLPSIADGILFSNIFHDWPVERVRFLTKKAFLALPKNGKIFIHEMLLNDMKNGPVTPATFNLLMYLNHGSQQFTENQLYTLLQEAGFDNCRRIDTHPYYSMIIGEKLK